MSVSAFNPLLWQNSNLDDPRQIRELLRQEIPFLLWVQQRIIALQSSTGGGGGGTGDMLKSVYDTNNNSIVDKAENGLPVGGTAGQYLAKNSATDYDTAWATFVSTTEGIWNFSTNNTMADPGAGKYRTNTTLFSTVTQLALSKTTAQNVDRTNLLSELRNGDVVTIQDRSNSANYARYTVNGAATNNTTWFQIPVTFINGGGTIPNNNTDCVFAFDMAQSPGSGGFGDMLKSTYDTNNNGIVDSCDSLPWARLTGVPATFTPAAHATTHKSGGSDTIKLDELAAPTDITTLNASASAHGLLQKLSGTNSQYLDGSGAWSTPAGVGGLPTGSLVDFAGSSAPSGFLLCDGSPVSRTTYSALFAVIGTTFGAGDGSSTFNVPDARGRTVIGVGQGTGLTNRALAATGGEETHVLLTGELASHTHTMGNHTHAGVDHTHPIPAGQFNHAHTAGYSPVATTAGAGSAVYASNGLTAQNTGAATLPAGATGAADRSLTTGGPSTNTSDATGSGTAHNTMQPFIALNKIIKT